MRAGRLKQRIVLQQKASPSPEQDSYGQVIHTWSTVATVWGAIDPITEASQYGFERTLAAQVRAEAEVRITIRYSTDVSGVDTTWRATSGGKNYAIKAVIGEELHARENRTIQLLCSEGVRDDE